MTILLVLLMLLVPSLAHATTYWVSTTGVETVCANVDGDADPLAYMTLTQMDTSNCAVAGDTIKLKDGTYTGTHIRFDQLIPSGLTPLAKSKILCESDRGCIIAFSSVPASGHGIIHFRNMSNFQLGQRGNGLIADCVNAGDTCAGIFASLTTVGIYSGLVIEGNLVRNNHASGLKMTETYPTMYYNGMSITHNEFQAPATPYYEGDGTPHTVYNASLNASLTHNTVTGFALANSYAIHCFHICTGMVVAYNYASVPNTGRGYVGGSNEIGGATGILVHHNVFKASASAMCIDGSTTGDGTSYFNNVCDGFSIFINNRATSVGNSFKNNVCAGTCTITDSQGDLSCGGTCSTINPTITMATHFVSPSTGNYSFKSGSAQINAGIATGLTCNGTCDRGAFESLAFASCTVNDGTANIIRVTFTNDVKPPLQITNSTGVTVRDDGGNNVVTGVEVSGDNILNITVTDSITNGQVVDWSYAQTGDLRDSSRINSVDQEVFAITNQGCTNNVGAAASHVFTQAAFEFHGLRGTEAAPVGTPYATAPENTNISVMVGGSVRMRLSLTCTTADCPPTGFYPRYSCPTCTTAGTYTVVPDTFATGEGIGFCGVTPDPDIPTNGTATTDQLSTAGTFVPGAFVRTSNAIPTINLDNSPAEKTELEYCFSFDPTVTAGKTFDIRLYEQDGTALGDYTVTPRMTIVGVSGGMGF